VIDPLNTLFLLLAPIQMPYVPLGIAIAARPRSRW